jgi:leucyl aminopeptidase
MQDFFHFHKVPSVTATEAKSNYHVSIITDLEAFKTAHGEFRANQLKTQSHQVVYESDKATHFFLKEAGEDGITFQKLEDLAICIVPAVKAFKISEIDVSLDVKLCSKSLGILYYSFTQVNYKYETKGLEDAKSSFITSINFVGVDAALLQEEDFKFYSILAESKAYGRDLANSRVNILNTNNIPDLVDEFLKEHPEVTKTQFVGEEVWNQGLRMHYSVGKGSANPPLFINLKYNGNPDSDEYHAIIGKGVIFDVGGTNMKQGPLMFWMFLDKGGACAVLAAFRGIVKAGLKVNLTCSVPFAENSVDGAAYRTSDVLKSFNGKTVEITNTDAEGRLLLADAMTWTQKNYKLNSMIELSTLTGASIVALGHEYACIMSNHDCIVDEITKAGKAINEKVWRLPLCDYIRKRIKNGPADLKNSSLAGDGGTIEAGCFLENFADKNVRWIHVDIAAAMINMAATFGPYSQGGTGFGVGFLMEHFRNISK